MEVDYKGALEPSSEEVINGLQKIINDAASLYGFDPVNEIKVIRTIYKKDGPNEQSNQ